ncbi:Increased rDNA silencing protein [Podospora pseudopauciseta]|uniref:Increased rDNA silencing protein n=1 Tax=Podospora pseudopauciseta TaxID=2093780 RepID=A0ABR0H198_9PEZI|nr:Increased rDNA silencing protein [Podospora pseudopauciseta]
MMMGWWLREWLSIYMRAVGGGSARQSSASFIAATLAASRSTSPIPNTNQNANNNGVTQARPGRSRGHSTGAASVLSMAPSLGPKSVDALDTESIMPTTSLVSLFESKGGEDVDPVKKRDAPTPRQQKVSPSLSPRGRSPGPAGEKQTQEVLDEQQTKTKLKPKPKPKPKKTPESTEKPKAEGESKLEHHGIKRPGTPPSKFSSPAVSTQVVSPQPRRVAKTAKLEPPALPPARKTSDKNTKTPTVEVTAIRSASMEEARPEEKQTANVVEQRPVPAAPVMRRVSECSMSSDDSFVSASSAQQPDPEEVEEPTPQEQDNKPQEQQQQQQQSKQAPKPPKSRRRPASSPPPRRPSAPRLSTPNLGLDSLTNAIVASNLASSRLTPSPLAPPPIPPPSRRHNPHHHHNDKSHNASLPQRTVDSLTPHRSGNSKSGSRSPKRTGMLTTLRQPPTSLSDDEDARRKMHRHAHRKGKVLGHHIPGRRNHAHHEGSRSRWRDEVTARQRRRYEAVWASNKGLFMRPGWGLTGGEDDDEEGRAQAGTKEADLVVNVVVRDIWDRSRLPREELAEIWGLVDRGGKGALGREEFVVGMWLVDQRLRGRRLPGRVGGSVWESVGQGVVRVLPPKGELRKKR